MKTDITKMNENQIKRLKTKIQNRLWEEFDRNVDKLEPHDYNFDLEWEGVVEAWIDEAETDEEKDEIRNSEFDAGKILDEYTETFADYEYLAKRNNFHFEYVKNWMNYLDMLEDHVELAIDMDVDEEEIDKKVVDHISKNNDWHDFVY